MILLLCQSATPLGKYCTEVSIELEWQKLSPQKPPHHTQAKAAVSRSEYTCATFRFCTCGISNSQFTRPARVLHVSPERMRFITCMNHSSCLWDRTYVFLTRMSLSSVWKNGVNEVNHDILHAVVCENSQLRAYCHIPGILPCFPGESLFSQEIGYHVRWHKPFARGHDLISLKTRQRLQVPPHQ